MPSIIVVAMKTLIFLSARLAVVLALAFAMTGTGFGHRVASADVDGTLTAYLAAGGTYADICDDAGTGHVSGATCDACRLVDSVSVPAGQVGDRGLALVGDVVTHSTAPRYHVTATFDPAHPPRAPPVV